MGNNHQRDKVPAEIAEARDALMRAWAAEPMDLDLIAKLNARLTELLELHRRE
jgi:hypothetical protein